MLGKKKKKDAGKKKKKDAGLKRGGGRKRDSSHLKVCSFLICEFSFCLYVLEITQILKSQNWQSKT